MEATSGAARGPRCHASGNPLANELLIGIGAKDVWNTQPPTTDGTEFLNYFAEPLLPQLLPSLYPGVFPNLAAYNGGVVRTRGPTSRRSSSPGSRPG